MDAPTITEEAGGTISENLPDPSVIPPDCFESTKIWSCAPGRLFPSKEVTVISKPTTEEADAERSTLRLPLPVISPVSLKSANPSFETTKTAFPFLKDWNFATPFLSVLISTAGKFPQNSSLATASWRGSPPENTITSREGGAGGGG